MPEFPNTFSKVLFLSFALGIVLPTANGQAQIPGIISEQTLDLSEQALGYSYLDSLEFKQIQYQSDSVIVEGFVVSPKHLKNVPIVIFNRGGNRDYSRIDERMLIDWISTISRHGYMVFASQYRYHEQFGGVDVDDVLKLLEVAKSYPNTDSTKIGMVGWSRGGLMTYLALTKTNEIDCAIIGGAPTNMFDVTEARPPIDALLAKLIPNYHQNRKTELTKRCPILWPEKLHQTNLLILHGDADTRVSSEGAKGMSLKLDSLDFQHRLMVIENEGHILNGNKALKDSIIADWLNAYLRN